MENPQSEPPIEPTRQIDEPAKPNRWAWVGRVNQKLHDHQNVVYIALVVLLALSAGLLIYFLTKPGTATVVDNSKLPVKKILISPLTGLEVKSQKQIDRPVTAVMIENSPDARPQSGLAKAGVVFETVAEGGITRFVALYQESQPKLIGPVRSLRPYFFNWADGFDAGIAHVGGSPEALSMVRGPGGKDLDQFFSANYYWRATDRWAPHNVYTSFAKLDALNKSKGYKHSKFTPIPRKKDTPAKQPTAKVIDVDISSALYNPSFHYQAKTNDYIRYQDGAPHIDRESKQPIKPKVVVVLKTPMHLEADGYHMSVKTVGKGQAYVFQDGTVTKATWAKSSAKNQLTLTNKDGKPIKLNAGMTWVTVTDVGKSVTWR